MAIHYNHILLYTFYKEWSDAKQKNNRSAISDVIEKVRNVLTNENGITPSKPTIYKILKQYSNEPASQKKERLDAKQIISIQKDLDTIAKVKQGLNVGKKGRAKSTESVINALKKEGKLETDYSRSHYDRLLKQNHLSNKHFKRSQQISTKLTTAHANRVLVFDATPVPQYYWNIKKKKFNFDTTIVDHHLDDYLYETKQWKVWIYVIRDLYSGAYWTTIDLPTGRGESALAWLTAFKEWILPKKDKRIPLCGYPIFVFSDRGSGGKSNAMKEFFASIDVPVANIRDHLPHRPDAKGFVESQIKAVQDKIFRSIITRNIKDFDALLKYIKEYEIRDNVVMGYYEKYYESIMIHPPKLPTDNLSNIHKKSEERVLDNYRTVKVKGEQYYLVGSGKSDLQEKSKVFIKTRLDGTMFAEDDYGFIYELRKKAIERDFETFEINELGEELKKNMFTKRRQEVLRESKKFVSELKQESFLPDVNSFKEYEIPMSDTVNAIAPTNPSLQYQAEAYLQQILDLAIVTRKEVPPDTIDAIKNALIEFGSDVTPELLKQFANAILTEINGD